MERPEFEKYAAAIFDLDGVVTRTAGVHEAAWKELFDDYLRQRAERTGEPFRPFDPESDYRRLVDGKPRYEGVRSFLESRGIRLPYGTPDDSPGRETICGLGNRKNEIFGKLLARGGVEVFGGTITLIRTLRDKGVKIALVSSSKNAGAVLDSAGLSDLFDARIDGIEAARLGLKGKPNPDIFIHAATLLGVAPARAFAVEDALSGIQAARAGGFRLVVGIDRRGDLGREMRQHGADIVVGDLGEFL